ncbi:MAG: hypothetical protein N0C81_19255 [Candidatus Thiodiazotropha lotti]|nr:hypothetical protein [Candidatus Thiodiazotropha lotti]ODB99991.1 hypothetical protein A3197_06285 [Candidatus Thiodiazotropha endoloripes]MCG7930699.1 hypothetical protein [Candidatus Thiodiazotropha lotti]MCG8003587.1 hypothetical protein [Candidatus Thiodiazotropha lotti]MCG8009767.1 hypothetical protein [Candidatus Thiodiazotropha lotti]
MISVIILFGALILIAGLIILTSPGIVLSYLKDKQEEPGLHILAVTVRLILGIFLISQSSQSKFPLIIEVLGWLSVIAAVVLTVIGRNGFRGLMSWALSIAKTYGRIGGLLAAAFGAFLIYAFM